MARRAAVRRPEETEATLAGGWLRTGDAGHRDEHGRYHVEDRVKDMIISGGENVYPAQVERVLGEHPGVAEVAVIGVPDEKWGETVKAVVVPSGELDPAGLLAFCEGKLAGYKRTTTVDIVEALPRDATGKVLKRTLREPYWRGRGKAS